LRLVAVNIFLYLGRGFWWSNLLPECLCLLILDRHSDHWTLYLPSRKFNSWWSNQLNTLLKRVTCLLLLRVKYTVGPSTLKCISGSMNLLSHSPQIHNCPDILVTRHHDLA
jgi:hypothetical protein